MPKRQAKKLPDLVLGPLPVEIINRTIGLELEPGLAVLTGANQVHAARRHPTDYPVCLPHLASIIAAPLFIGDDHRNPGKIELIARVRAADSMVLVAVEIRPDGKGRYRVASFYPVKAQTVQSRREKGFLKVARVR